MKKLAFGCLVTLGLLAIVGAIAASFLYTRYVRPAARSVAQLAEFADLDTQVANHAAFVEPARGELTEVMVVRFMKVQQHVEQQLGSRMTTLEEKFTEVDARAKAKAPADASLRDGIALWQDVKGIVVDARRAQVEAINQAGFSAKEYEWVRRQVYAAVGIVAPGGLDVSRLAREASGSGEAPADVPERNKQLVAPYAKQLRAWAPLALFGI
jgi:hypothetical protein